MKNVETVDGLLRVVADYERNRCNEIHVRADDQVRALVHDAWRSARARLHDHVVASRQERRHALARAEAELGTARRRLQQRRDRALLDVAWEPLRAAVLARWRDSQSRQSWLDAIARLALARLPHVRWTIAHPPDWPERERVQWIALLAQTLGDTPDAIADRAISAGLCVRAGEAQLDATVEGLLADRNAIEARLLAALGT